MSLHRAEGYGLTMAEAMAAGRPVIGTGYSGNLEFMTPDTSVLVPVRDGADPVRRRPVSADRVVGRGRHRRGRHGDAEPGIRSGCGPSLGAAARAHIVNEHTVGSRVDFVRARLHESEEQSMSYLDPARPPEERIQQAIVHGPDMTAPGRFGGFTRFVRHIVGRAVKYERDFNLQIDVALLDKLHEIENDLGRRSCRQPTTGFSGADDELREADQELREVDTRARARAARAPGADQHAGGDGRRVADSACRRSTRAPRSRTRSRPAPPTGSSR